MRRSFLLLALLGLLVSMVGSPARGADDVVELPFLLRGGEDRRDAVLTFPGAPSAAKGGLDEPSPEDPEDQRRAFDKRNGPLSIPFPLVDELLEPLHKDLHAVEGRVKLQGTPEIRARARRLLKAVHAGFSRRVRVELLVLRPRSSLSLATAGQSADALLKSPPTGVDVLARVDRELTEGAVWHEDRRKDVTYRGAVDVNAQSLSVRPVIHRVGAIVAVSACWAGRTSTKDGSPARWMARIAVDASTVIGKRTLQQPPLNAEAPRLHFLSLALDVPVVPGRATRIQANGRHGFIAVVRITPRALPAAPSGTRAYGLHGRRPLFGTPEEIKLALLSEEEFDEEPWALGDGAPSPDPRWQRAVGTSGRLTPVEPGLLIAEGAERDLLRLDAAVLRSWDEGPRPVSVTLQHAGKTTLRLPLFAGRAGHVLWGIAEPVAVATKAEVATGSGFTASYLKTWISGTLVRFSHEQGLTSVRVDRARLAGSGARVTQSVRQTGNVTESTAIPLDDLNPQFTRKTSVLTVSPDVAETGIRVQPWSPTR